MYVDNDKNIYLDNEEVQKIINSHQTFYEDLQELLYQHNKDLWDKEVKDENKWYTRER